MTPQEFREQHDHGDYTTWSDETYDLYFAIVADNATDLTARLQSAAVTEAA